MSKRDKQSTVAQTVGHLVVDELPATLQQNVPSGAELEIIDGRRLAEAVLKTSKTSVLGDSLLH